MEIVMSLLEVVAKLVPGFLALFTGTESDEEAIKKAQDCVPDEVAGAWEKDLNERVGRVTDGQR